MNGMLVALAVALVASWIPQAALVFGYISRLRRWRVPLIDDQTAPEGLVILCLRGGDPFLARCIDGLLTQDYPRYHIRFMVDHAEDPSLPILKAALAKHTFEKYEILFLENPLATCGLKSSCQVQAIETDRIYDESFAAGGNGQAFVALLDADTIPHPTWLRQLATALQEPDVGAATGNRWYIPDRPALAALSRRIWNSAAIVQMYFYRIAWGGTLALKVSSIREAKLLERWKLALCEDTMTQKQLSRIGQRLEFVPGLIMVNREDCNFSGMVPWMRRQLFTTRLYHPMWWPVVFHGISSALLLAWGWSMAIAFALLGNWTNALITVSLMVAFQAALTVLLLPLKAAIAAIIEARGESSRPEMPATPMQACLAIIVTQWVYTYALFSCMSMRQVSWRGIDYRADGPWKIRMLGYRPYASATEVHESL